MKREEQENKTLYKKGRTGKQSPMKKGKNRKTKPCIKREEQENKAL